MKDYIFSSMYDISSIFSFTETLNQLKTTKLGEMPIVNANFLISNSLQASDILTDYHRGIQKS